MSALRAAATGGVHASARKPALSSVKPALYRCGRWASGLALGGTRTAGCRARPSRRSRAAPGSDRRPRAPRPTPSTTQGRCARRPRESGRAAHGWPPLPERSSRTRPGTARRRRRSRPRPRLPRRPCGRDRAASGPTSSIRFEISWRMSTRRRSSRTATSIIRLGLRAVESAPRPIRVGRSAGRARGRAPGRADGPRPRTRGATAVRMRWRAGPAAQGPSAIQTPIGAPAPSPSSIELMRD